MKLIQNIIRTIVSSNKKESVKECPGECGTMIHSSSDMCTACMLEIMADIIQNRQYTEDEEVLWQVIPPEKDLFKIALGHDKEGRILISQRGTKKWKELFLG